MIRMIRKKARKNHPLEAIYTIDKRRIIERSM